MPRVKRGVISRAKHKKVLKAAEGFRGPRGKLTRQAIQSTLKAGQHAYAGRRLRRRDARREWIVTINAALTGTELNYSKFIALLIKKEIKLDRKVLSDMILTDRPFFDELVKTVQK